jgi:endonuclease III
MSIGGMLDCLEQRYGVLRAPEPSDPYEHVLWANCGYPPSEENCRRGFDALKHEVGLATRNILSARAARLVRILRTGGIVPELRAERLKWTARVVETDYGGDLHSALQCALADARKILKRFPTIGDPGADKILLFSGRAPVPAVPSNCVHVPLRLGVGTEGTSYAQSYRSVREAFAEQLPSERRALERAYLLFKHHGQVCCKRGTPLCESCPLCAECPFFAKRRPRAQAAPRTRAARRPRG